VTFGTACKSETDPDVLLKASLVEEQLVLSFISSDILKITKGNYCKTQVMNMY
jgi:hypothetical protein